MAHSKPRLVVGLDFGTTFSGFAYAHITEPDMVYTFFDYNKAGGAGKPYCKTLTASYYKKVGGTWQFKSWGYPARAECARDIQALRKQRARGSSSNAIQSTVGTYDTRFKLHLAGRDLGGSTAQPLPPGLTVNVVITDYLREMGALVLKTLQEHYGAQLTKQAIQWCFTVPSIWDNAAKAVMKTCMTSAGLVDGVDGSRHPLILVLEPEAASLFCHKVMSQEQVLRVGEKLVVADIGGGTSDIVVQEVVSVGESGYRVREVTTSSGGLCGGSYVDARYMEFLQNTIGPCLQECILENSNVYSLLMQAWELIKANFGERTDIGESIDINLPAKVARKWEEYDLGVGNPLRNSYDELEISFQEMQSIFDPIIEQNMELIAQQLEQVKEVKVLVVVGGFEGSPYLLGRIRARFPGVVSEIMSPPNPGSAVCHGAVMLALNPGTFLSRVAKKTYGIGTEPLFDEGLDPDEYRIVRNGEWRCENRFGVYVRKGARVDLNSCISKVWYYPSCLQVGFIRLYSSDDANPRYTIGETVRKEGEISIDLSKSMALGMEREVKVSLFLGGSSMEVKAEAVNFSAEGPRQLELPIEVDFF